MRNFFTLISLFCLFNINGIGSNRELPPIDTLQELPVKLIADFRDHDEIASYAEPVITKNGDLFFYDTKYKQIFKTSITDPVLKPLGRNGEGPKEYTFVNDLFLSQEMLYILESKQKLLCFGINGEYKWEMRTGFRNDKIIGKKGNTFYLSGISKMDKKKIYFGLYSWENREKHKLIMDAPIIHYPMQATVNGKITSGGFYIVTIPVYTYIEEKDLFITASNTNYCFTILNSNFDLQKTISIDAPQPEINETVKTNFPTFSKKNYAIADIFYHSPYFIVLSNYYKDRKQRIDFFSLDGEYKKSFLLPFQGKPNEKNRSSGKITLSVSNGYLLITDNQEIGFSVYRSQELD